MSEVFDIYDEAFKHIGVKPRDAVHRDGDWHQVFHCWVIGREANGDAFLILQKRAADRDYANKIDISAAGHLEAGETVRDGVREIEEELGLQVDFEDLIPLGQRLGVKKIGDFIDCQICHVYLYECDQTLEDYHYLREEIAGLLKLRIYDGLRLFAGDVECVNAAALGLGAAEIAITKDDFIKSVDNYIVKILILARRYFAGETELWI